MREQYIVGTSNNSRFLPPELYDAGCPPHDGRMRGRSATSLSAWNVGFNLGRDPQPAVIIPRAIKASEASGGISTSAEIRSRAWNADVDGYAFYE